MRSMWKGQLGFGMVSLSVKMYKGVDEDDIRFHLVHPQCGGRVKQNLFCPQCECLVQRQELKKGYEVGKDKYLILDEADFEKLPLKSLKAIDIEGFVQDRPDPRAFEESYLIAPEKGSEKAFQLILGAMEKLGVKAVAKIAYREREHLCLVSPYQGVLLLQTLFYAGELRGIEEIKPKAVALSDKEVELGVALVKQMVIAFNYEGYHDDYRLALEKLIEAKAEGKVLAGVAEATATPGDLVGQLMASLGLGVKGQNV